MPKKIAKPTATDSPTAVELAPDFIGLINERGVVIVDDTAHFRGQKAMQPIWDRLQQTPRVAELNEQIDALMQRVRQHDEELGRDLSLTHGWLEGVMVGVFSEMLREATAEKATDTDA